jgi:hypothetical protein
MPATTKNQTAKNRAAQSLTMMEPNAAGVDIGSTEHWVAVSPDRDEQSVRKFGTFTCDLYAIADWLRLCEVRVVAMESTGVYWIPLFEVLVERGFQVDLVDARHTKNVSGRKADTSDCEWIRQLRSYGTVESGLHSGSGHDSHSQLCTAPPDVDSIRGHSCSTHAKSPNLDESPTAPCH